MVAAGGDLAEAAALTATANKIIQDADSVGTALKTTSLRLRGTDVKVLEEEGLDSEGAVTSKSKLQGKVKALSGVDILTATGEYKSTYEILSDIAEVWRSINDMDQAALLELISGKRNSSVIAAILQNPQELKDAFEDANNASGSALKENEKYLDSIQGKIDKFNNTVQTMWSNTLDSGVVKLIVDLGTGLIKIVDKLGLINTLVLGIMTYMSIFKKNKFDFASLLGIHDIDKGWTIGKEGATGWFAKKLFPNKQKEINVIGQDIDDITDATKDKIHQAKVDIKEDTDGQLIFDFDSLGAAQGSNASSKYLDIFNNGLQGDSTKLVIEDTKQLGIELDKLNNMDNQGVIDYMSSLDNLGDVGDDTKRVLAGYASTVKDGNYTVQGAQQYVNQYNQQLEQTSKSATKARLAQAGLNLAISLVTMALTALITKLIELATKAQKKFDKLTSELSETESELKDINSQLDETKERIQELQEQGALTFTDREELDRLRALNEELERQKQLTENIQKQQQKGVNEAAIDAANQYKKTRGDSGETFWQRTGKGATTGLAIGGAAAGTALAVSGGAAALGTAATGLLTAAGATGAAAATQAWNPVGWGLAVAAGILAIGGIIGGGIAAASAAMDTKVGESMENMREEHEKLQEKYEKKRQKFAEKGGSGRRKRMEKASEELAEYESMMAEHFAEMDKYYSSIDLSVYDTVKDAETIERLRTEMNEFYDTRDKWLIQSGAANSKSNAISRIFGENASQDLKDIKKQIQDALKAGAEFNFNDAFGEDFKRRLHDMGLTVADVKYYFMDLKKAEDEAAEFTTDEAIKSVANLADKVDSLKSAFEEFNETGIVTAKTLVELSEVFGGLGDKWTNFVNIMASGTASTEEAKEAINELIETLITSALSGEKIGTEEYLLLFSQLTNMGVDNASELLKGIQDYSSIGEQIANEVMNGKKNIDEAIASYEKANNVVLTAEQKQVVRATYEAKNAKSKADTYKEQAEALKTLALEYERAKETEDEWENAVEDAEDTKSGKFLWWNTKTDTDEERETNAILNEEKAAANRLAVAKQISQLYKEVFGEEGNAWSTNNKILELQTYFENPQNYDELSEEAQATLDDLGNKLGLKVDFEFEDFDTVADKVQSAYSTLKDITTEYNTQGYLSLDNLQALLNLSPEYLAVLKMEGGQLTINQSALQSMLETKLADAEATAVQTAITQLNALAERKKAIEVSNSAVAANQASIELGTYSGALSTVASDAIVAAGSVAAFNAALKGAQDNEFVSDEEWQQVLTNFQNTVGLIDSVRDNLPTSFNNILDPGSKTPGQEEAESEWDRLVAKYENRLALITNERDLIEAEIDKAEARGGKASAEYYEDLLRTSTEEKALLEEQYTALSNYLEANKDAIDQDTWTDYNNTLNEVAVAIKECEINTIAWQEALREIDIHYFEQATDEISRLGEELEFVNNLLEDEDVADENGNWSSAALTRMAMYTNLIEKAAADTQRYQDEIAKLEGQYKGGELSEEQYQERLATLTDGLYDSINAQNDARESIVELNEARIDAIKEGIEKEIEAYEDLIDAKKEELDAERDLYDFRKNIKKQTKDISELERRIASLSGSSAASDVAARRRLEAQLMEAKEGLNDTYYDHSRDARSSALDDESEAYRKSQEKRIEQLEETLDNVELLIQNSMMDVLFNADIVYNELNDIADTYGITLSDELTQPWKDASAQAIAWKDELKLSMTSGEYAALIGEGGAITVFANGVGSKLSGSWNTAKTAVEKYSNFLTGTELGNKFASTITGFANQIQKIIDKWNGVKTAADNAYQAQLRVQNVGGNPNAGSGSGSGSSGGSGGIAQTTRLKQTATVAVATTHRTWESGKQTDNYVTTIEGKQYLFVPKMGMYYPVTGKNPFNYKDDRGKRDAGYSFPKGTPIYKYYAKGTTGTTRDEWAITDEFGPELKMYATPEGNLSFMALGSTVVPHDLTMDLIELPSVVDGLINRPNFDSGINMISNAINKPEIKLDIENFLNVGRVDQDTLPALEKMMDKKINEFSRQLNYALKGKGAR